MNTQELSATTPSLVGAAQSSTPHAKEVRARIGLTVDRQSTPAGLVELRPLTDHRLKIHAGEPVRGTCRFHRFHYTRGDIDILPAGVSDVWREDNSSTSLMLQFSPLLLRQAAEDLGADPDSAGLETRHQIRDPQIEHIGWALDADRAAGYPDGLLYSETLGAALAIHLLRRYQTPLKVSGGLSKPQLRRMTAYIEEHLDQNLSLRQLAEIASVSASHLKTLFKRSTGLPVHEYVIRRRVERAKELLIHSELPASRIALDAGFAHQSHMARSMRRVLGLTPASLVRRPRRP